MRSDLIAMTPKEIQRLEVLQRLAAGVIRQRQAAAELKISAHAIKEAPPLERRTPLFSPSGSRL